MRTFYKMLKRRYRFKYGFEISANAQIGEGFYLSDHCGPVVIGPVKIGKYCNICHCVTIGRAYKDGKIGRPTIDDYVWIGTGSVLVGNISIGKNVLMANDVPESMGKTNENENRSKISISAESQEEADKLFNGLSAGGKIEMPIADSPWGSYFGMFRDKYGIEWMVDFDPKYNGQI